MNCKPLILSGCAIMLAQSLLSANFYWVGASNDWRNAASYSSVAGGEGGTQMPGEDDRVVLSKNQRVYVDDSTIAFFSTIKEVQFAGTNIVANFNITTNANLGCYFGSLRIGGEKDSVLVKTGLGRLSFAKRGDADLYKTSGKDDTLHYMMDIDLREGELALEPAMDDKDYRHRYGNVAVGEDCTLYGVEKGITWFDSLSGAGMVTNTVTSDESRLYVVGKRSEPTVFSGVLAGFSYFFPQGHTWYTGTKSTIGRTIRPAGYTGAADVGITGYMTFAGPSTDPSSLGTGNIDGRNAGRLLYLGTTGETIERTVTLWNTSAAPFVWDAGAYGGIEFTGTFTATGAAGAQQRLVLTGSNMVPCVMRSKFVRNSSFGASGSLFHITKQGCGTWRFIEPDDSTELSGVIGVEEGVLECNTLRDAGIKSALGSASELYADQSLAVTNGLTAVPYAHFFGGTGTAGTLRYLGEVPRTIRNRPIVLKGDGRIEAPTALALNWVGVSGMGEGEKTLAVDCRAWQTNRYANITNGNGILSVKKTGPGDLVLSGELSFNGDIVASGGGTLTVKDICGQKYEYYRLTLKETVYTSPKEEFSDFKVSSDSGTRTVGLNEFGLYDTDGNRVNMEEESTSGAESVSQLGYGQIALESQDSHTIGTKSGTTVSYSPWRLLDNNCSGGYKFAAYWSDEKKVPKLADPLSWVSLVYRMRQGSKDAAFFDLNFQKGFGISGFGQNPTAFSLSASVDGLNYEELYSSNDCITASSPTYDYWWLSDGSSAWKDSGSTKPENVVHAKIPLPHSSAQTAYNVLGNVRSISADRDSVLRYEGVLPKVVSGLAAEASGIGTIEGFAFADSGTLYLTGVEDGSIIVNVEADLAGVSGLDNLKDWELSVNGYANGKYSIASVSSTGIRLVKPSLRIVIR